MTGSTSWRRRLAVAAALVAGLPLGSLGASALQGEPRASVPPPPPDAVAVADADLPAATEVLLAWTPDRLPDGLIGAPVDGTDGASVVRAGRADLLGSWDAVGTPAPAPPAGLAFPLDAIAFDAEFASFAPAGDQQALVGLQPGEALLGTTAARLRGVGAGGSLELAGAGRLRVAAVVDDGAIGGAELAVPATSPLAAGWPARYVLYRLSGTRADVEDAVRAAAGAGTPVRFRAPGETPYLRHGDAVLPPALIKERFGEFAYRLGGGRSVIEDVAWQHDHIVTVQLPVLGQVQCHRALVPALRGAMEELERLGLAVAVVPGGGDGCWNARLTEAGGELSRHAWGAAVDFNVGKNPTGLNPVQDPRFVEVMERWGFTWGGRWLIPDGAHFEYLEPPETGR